jgi:hypothetical protein
VCGLDSILFVYLDPVDTIGEFLVCVVGASFIACTRWAAVPDLVFDVHPIRYPDYQETT